MSLHLDCVIKRFVGDCHSIECEILFHFDVQSLLKLIDLQHTPDEKEVLIASTSSFVVKSVEYLPFRQVEGETSDTANDMISTVTLNSWMSWHDFDIDNCPPSLIIW
jgi:hypothetical protein